ncbi:MAG: hypothetical protein HC933_17340 [Pleurocapsa sp. SU_196_0]|nr:hypothetical protein [Pleurocapsa sp. SU_196_0]
MKNPAKASGAKNWTHQNLNREQQKLQGGALTSLAPPVGSVPGNIGDCPTRCATPERGDGARLMRVSGRAAA